LRRDLLVWGWLFSGLIWRVESGACIDFSGGFGDHLCLADKGFRHRRNGSGPVLISRFTALFAALAACLLSSVALAQSLRQLPDDVVVTTMVAQGGAAVMLGEQKVMLSPAAQVRNANNMIVMPSNLYGSHVVGVKTDFQGMVNRIWILSPQEQAALAKRKK
jgi:hypothetical protein